jgi:uncharacterized protein HemX
MDPNMNPMNNMQTPPQGPAAIPPKPASSAGTIVAVVVILAMLVIGGFYFWGQRADNSMAPTYEIESDETADIEADLNSTDVDNVDYDLNPENFNAS